MRLPSLCVMTLCGLAVLSTSCGTQPVAEKGPEEAPVKQAPPPVDGNLVTGDGYTLVVPKTWLAVDLSKEDVEKELAKLKGDPNFDRLKAGTEAIKVNQQVKHFVLIPEHSNAAFGANLNIMVLPLPPGAKASDVFKANAQQLKAAVGKEITFKESKLGSADGGHVEWAMPMQGQNLTVNTVIAVTDKSQTVFTFTIPTDKIEKARAAVQKTIGSIKFE